MLGTGVTKESTKEAIPAPWNLESCLETGEEDQAGSGEAKSKSDSAMSLRCDEDLLMPAPIYESFALPT